MTRRNIVLADANIFIFLDKFRFFDFLHKISSYYGWKIMITPAVENECKNLFTSSRLKSLKNAGTIGILYESSRDILNSIVKLEKYMELGAEVELFAIAENRKCNVITHDIENTQIYHINFGRENFWVYDLYRLFYLANKSGIINIDEAEKALSTLKGSDKVMPSGFLKFVRAVDENISKHIDPLDTSKFQQE